MDRTGEDGSDRKAAVDIRPTAGKQESTLSSLHRMKEDLLRDQAKLDRQLGAAGEQRVPQRPDNVPTYERERSSSNYYDVNSRRNESRSSYATGDRAVRLCLMVRCVVRLSVVCYVCTVAKRYAVQKNCLKHK